MARAGFSLRSLAVLEWPRSGHSVQVKDGFAAPQGRRKSEKERKIEGKQQYTYMMVTYVGRNERRIDLNRCNRHNVALSYS